ncbi:aminomethyl-transferring glycine dehydrogenase [Sansalvadorimonas sp. 2012CJ34-2]|uniref:Glycine dehydrogenase (decarboxylating) n=1 Tax=Parendozoicomonas callyspongiae TaxID=2942213 RepID=A0ABT0PG24_9GAMM|nr:aminomethyl-transferring glycine dehydrogenase [Sansalvadorimonas sp. 2012CJ34-2]MCL6270293.1 aminomethyl-transferring glycine dehydrogenase [Sansalvadorimonas sp. 2012CJ34-2]
MSKVSSLKQLENTEDFIRRHIGPGEEEISSMLEFLGEESLESMLASTVPGSILQEKTPLEWDSHTEQNTLGYLKGLLSKNKPARSFIGMGYHGVVLPPVIQRNVLENPGWYTAYTPYQPEIAQGRLEAILNFQQMTLDLTGLDLASASLLDEGTAAGEAMSMAQRVSKNKKSNLFFVDEDCHPQTIDVVKTRAKGFDVDIIVGPASEAASHDVFGALLAYTGTWGDVRNPQDLIADLQSKKAVVAVVADIMSLVLLEAPGKLGVDIVLGSAQRFGVPMGYGGPHAAFFATSEKYKRSMPGRIIGVSVDASGKKALRMAMQTREQHIRREKATSNICTSQVLLANMAGFFAVYHGPQGLRTIAERIHRLADILAVGLQSKGVELANDTWFDTITVKTSDAEAIIKRSREAGVCLREAGDKIGISLDEATTREDIALLWDVVLGEGHGLNVDSIDVDMATSSSSIPADLLRHGKILEHPVFNSYHSETEMMRYLKRLENRDLALNHSMIPLGSCTMKLNAASEMMPVSWPEIGNLHPFTPVELTEGVRAMISELEVFLQGATGFPAISIQPNSGAQGEYAGLMAIQGYHESRGDHDRNICLIPASAHGTNPASAMVAGMKVVVTPCDEKGNVDVAALKAKAEELKDNLSCLMITYPSTHGVYEEEIREICDVIHANGGQVYMDGANLNAQVGISQPADIGADVTHMNLHKTFAIPHGGGGPGMGPIGVAAHLAPFLANHSVVELEVPNAGNTAVSSAPWGSVGVLPITWTYMRNMGGEGLRKATSVAILNANYLAKRLKDHYPVLYTGRNDRVAHECILDIRPLKAATGISEEDIAKRLMDFGYHAPTMSFPVAGTLMVEPTESESKVELDKFISAMISIREEMDKVANGEWPLDNNPLVRAPHVQAEVLSAEWDRPYTRQEATYPVAFEDGGKFWPTVNRIDNVYGDRNLFCSCIPVEEYKD